MDYYRRSKSEDFAEVVKFYGLSKDNNETMSEYYRRLQVQADKSGVNCCQDRIIRGRLIQAVTDPDIIMAMSNLQSPTSQDVLDKHNEMEGQSTFFDLIVPYLSLPDIAAISQLTLRWKRIVDRYIMDGKRITIDNHLIRKYPLERNRSLYSQFKNAKNIALRGIREDNLAQFVKYFDQMNSFAIIEMTILKAHKFLPHSLKELTISNSKIDKCELKKWFTKHAKTLHTLYLDRVHIEYSPYPVSLVTFDDLDMFTELKHLRLRGKDINVWKSLPQLRSLSIVAYKENILHRHPNLEHLHYDVPDLKRLWEFLRGENGDISKLRSIKIARSVDPKYRGLIESLNLEKVEVHYLEYAKEDQPYNILRVLNEDCLGHIIGYLSVKDCSSLVQTHPRIEDIIIRKGFFDLHDTSFEVHGIMFDRPKFICSIVKRFHMENCRDETYLRKNFPHLTGLKSLVLDGISLSKDLITLLPTKLDSITLFKVTVANGDNSLGTYLGKLRNMKAFRFGTNLSPRWIEKLFQNNKESLEQISLFVPNREPLETYTIDWRSVQALVNLNHFTLRRIECFEHRYSDIDKNQGKYLKKMFTILDMCNIHKITLEVTPEELLRVIKGGHLKHVKELEVLQRKAFDQNQIDALCSLVHLRKLTLRFSLDNMQEKVLEQIIASCPKLTHLGVTNFTSDFAFEQKLREKLRETGRHIEFKKVDRVYGIYV